MLKPLRWTECQRVHRIVRIVPAYHIQETAGSLELEPSLERTQPYLPLLRGQVLTCEPSVMLLEPCRRSVEIACYRSRRETFICRA